MYLYTLAKISSFNNKTNLNLNARMTTITRTQYQIYVCYHVKVSVTCNKGSNRIRKQIMGHGTHI